MKNNSFHIFVSLVIATLFTLTTPLYAQPSDRAAADCEELSDPDIKYQLDLCTAHVGCGLVMGIHKACVKSKKFLTNLKNIITRDDTEVKEAQAADTSLFGKLKSFVGGLGKKEVTSNQVYEASMSDQARSLQSTDKDWKDSAAPIKTGISKADKQQLTGAGANGSSATYTYVGDVKDGKANGWGTQYWSTGQITRGQFKDDGLNGSGEIALANGAQRLGSFQNGNLEGSGLSLLADGRIYKGQFSGDAWHGTGAVYRADGTLIANGQYAKNALSVGTVYDPQGNITQSIDKPRDEQIAREAAEHDFRNQLATMTAPELFGKADELSRSDRDKAEQMRQALLSRFPSHPLAIRLNEQIASERAAQAEAQRQQVEARRRQELLARQQAEQARQQAERDRIAAEQAKREKDARELKALQDATKFMEALAGAVQQRRQGNSDSGASSGNGNDPCPNGGNLVNGRCRFGVAQ